MEQQKYQHFEADTGTRDSLTWEFDGIRMGHAVSRFRALTEFTATSAMTDVVRLHIGLRGNYSFQHRQLDSCFDLVGGHHNILYSKDFEMTVYNRTLELETFGVQFPRETFLNFTQNATDLLKRFSDRIINGEPVILAEDWGAVDPGIQQVVDQILHHRYTGDLQRLFLLSKSIELLVLCAESCDRATRANPQYLRSNADKEKILAARDLVNERVHCPPSLSEVARTVGLNEYKLKSRKTSKLTFHTTVLGYLTAQRLQPARRYLLDYPETAAADRLRAWVLPLPAFQQCFRENISGTLPIRLEGIRKTQLALRAIS